MDMSSTVMTIQAHKYVSTMDGRSRPAGVAMCEAEEKADLRLLVWLLRSLFVARSSQVNFKC
eukprot:3791921-Pleurochrysis_carterae.AAC.1